MSDKDRLQAQLAALGITRAVAGYGTYDGTPCMFLRWNGQQDAFFGWFDELDFVASDFDAKYSWWRDENLLAAG